MEQYPEQYSESWNFGPIKGMIDVEEIVRRVIREWGGGQYRVLQQEAGEHEAGLLVLDAAKARMRLKWRPVYGVDESIQRTISWYKSFYQKVKPELMWESTLQDICHYQENLGSGELVNEAV